MNARIHSPICEVPGCGAKRAQNGSRWCGAHLSRHHRTGDVRADVPVKRQYIRSGPKPPKPAKQKNFDLIDDGEL